MIREALAQVVEKKNLTAETAKAVMDQMIGGRATQSQIGSFITAMRMKGETEDEIRGFVSAMRAASEKIDAPEGAVDMCGTGGDCSNTFNISTVASLVVASAGVPVAKHGNRSVSSRCGSADVLAALGLPYDLPPEMVRECLFTCNIGFMFAPVFHSSMRNVIGPRREVGIRTFFNLLGPMTNPANVRNQVIGVYDPHLAETVARVLRDLGSQHAMVVHGSGMDELTTAGSTSIVELNDGRIEKYSIEPGMFGIDLVEPHALAGGDSFENARTMMSILRGRPSPKSDVVALNAAAGLRVSGTVANLEEGVEKARNLLSAGKALLKAREFAEVSTRLDALRQERADASTAQPSRFCGDVLKRRAGELSGRLLAQVSGNATGRELLKNLDARLVTEPNVLSVIALNRILSVVSDGLASGQDLDNMRKSSVRFSQALASSAGVAVIAEYKPRSPTTPPLVAPPRPSVAAEAYSKGGAVAMSVLAEPDFFSGGPDLFSSMRSMTRLPVLFKDFIMSETQLDAASVLGADAVLLIARMLDQEALDRFIQEAAERGLEPLVELHDWHDLDKLHKCDSEYHAGMVGVNSRDLRTMEIDLEGLEELVPCIGDDKLIVAESGISRPEDFQKVRGCDAALIGSAFMAAEDPELKVRELVEAGRRMAR